MLFSEKIELFLIPRYLNVIVIMMRCLAERRFD